MCTYVSISSFQHNSNELQTRRLILATQPPPQNEPLKSPPRLGLTKVIFHNMLIRSPDSLNVYRPSSLVDHVDENGNLTDVEQRKDITGDIWYPLQTPRSGHNARNSAKAIRDEFKDYFITEDCSGMAMEIMLIVFILTGGHKLVNL